MPVTDDEFPLSVFITRAGLVGDPEDERPWASLSIVSKISKRLNRRGVSSAPFSVCWWAQKNYIFPE